MWRRTRRGDRYVTVIIDLTPVRDRSGPARLLDVVPGRSKKVLQTWLAAQGESWRGWVEVVAMDGFTGFKSAAGEELPQARAVMDPFHVVSLAGDKLDQCRRRIQRAITGRRGRAGDRLYRARRTLHTGAGLLTDAQTERLETLSSPGFCGGWFIWCWWLPVVIVRGGGGRVPGRLRARRGFAYRWRSEGEWCPYQCTHSAVASTGGVDVLPGSLVADQLGLVQRVERLGQGKAEGSRPSTPPRRRHHTLIGPARSGWLGTARRGRKWCTRPVRSAP